MGMISRVARTTLVRASYAAFFAVGVSISAAAQDEGEKKPKEPPDSAKVAEWKKEAEALALFQGTDQLAFTLTANYKPILRDRDTLSVKEYWGELSMPDDKGGTFKTTVQLRTRGHFRLLNRNCGFVPLRVDFVKKDMKGTVFEGQDKLKLITHCNGSSQYEQYVIGEYLAYRVHNIVTPRSHRARLLRVTYVDSATGKVMETRNAIFLEHEDDVAKRMEGQVAELRRALFDDVDFNQINETAIFEYFIGNTDWSLYALHNIRLVRKLDGTLLPLAYDLDFSGLVGTRYATPDPRLNIRSVKDRLYRGPCRQMEEFEPHFAVYRQKEAELMKVYENVPGLDKGYAKDAQNYLKEFFNMLKRPGDLKFMFIDNCRKQPSV